MARPGYDGRGSLFPLTIPLGADIAFSLTVTDSAGAAIDMSGATIEGELYTNAGVVVDTFAAVVSGDHSEVVTLSLTDTETAALAAVADWTLWVTRGGDKRPWLAGKVDLVSASSPKSTAGSSTTLVVDSDVNVAVSVNAVGVPGGVAPISGAAVGPTFFGRDDDPLRRWRWALADADYTAATISCIGDSITMGNDANNAAGGTTFAVNEAWKQRGWVGQLRSLFADKYGDPGEGFILLSGSNVDPRVNHIGTVTAQYYHGPHQFGWSMSTVAGGVGLAYADSIPDSGVAEIDVYTWWDDGTTGQYQVQWNAGSVVAGPTPPSGTDKLVRQSITKAGDTFYTRQPTSNVSYIFGFGIHNQAEGSRTGVIVHNIAKAGVTTDIATGVHRVTDDAVIGATDRSRIIRSTFEPQGADLVVVMLGANDYWYQTGSGRTSPGVDVTPTTFRANLQLFCDLATQQNGQTHDGKEAAVLLIAGPRRPTWAPDAGGDASPTFTESEYYTAMREVADGMDHVAFWDQGAEWASQQAAEDAGLSQANGVHPLRRGHGYIASRMFDLLS